MSTLAALLALTPLLLDAPVAAPPDPQSIAGGQPVDSCGWPSVVLLRGNGYLCTGNLIHPEIVATAAHCITVMEPDTRVYFGDTANSAFDKVDVEYCMGSPDFVDNGDGTIPFSEVQNDWGFCKLAEPVTDVTPIPPLYGCEMDLLAPGTEIVRVGFGKETLATNQFFKRWVQTTIVSIPFTGANGWPTQLSEGGGGEGTCPGDSGGPAFIRVPVEAGGDGSWRMVAIQSTQPVEDANGDPIECGTEPNNTAVLAQGVEFIESHSGIDITPCFDVDGSWNPTFDCSGFPLEPGAGGGNWPNNCEPTQVGEFAGACGSPFDQLNPDLTAPQVAIIEPAATVDEPFTGEPLVVHVVADADDGTGWGVSHVELAIIDATTQDELARFSDDTPPFEWDPAFPQGEFWIRAHAFDNAGLEAHSDILDIRVGVEPPQGGSTTGAETGGPEQTTGDDSTASTSGTGGVGETSDAGSADTGGGTSGASASGTDAAGSADATEDGSDGCGCRAEQAPAGGVWLVLGLGLLLRRRDPTA